MIILRWRRKTTPERMLRHYSLIIAAEMIRPTKVDTMVMGKGRSLMNRENEQEGVKVQKLRAEMIINSYVGKTQGLYLSPSKEGEV